MRVADLIADASCRFADDLYPVEHRVLQQFVGVEARRVILDVAPDPADRGQDVRQTLTVVSHRATASARPGPGCAPSGRGVATSTGRPTISSTTSAKPLRSNSVVSGPDRSCCGGPGTTRPFPGTTCYSCPSQLHGTRGQDLSHRVMPGQPTGGNTRCSVLYKLGEPGKQPVQSSPTRRTGSAATLCDRTAMAAR